eukprot:TRINITY_DN10731_c0_g2_i2.p6 TRINITY_DN10731_c0_g2~~TRINITY_DN10731_c0_g2_i2.p6  ORF type:complete len:113 (+),score=5.98 TRINITY_DN10731_c0_g2_i2:2385-2723(+)
MQQQKINEQTILNYQTETPNPYPANVLQKSDVWVLNTSQTTSPSHHHIYYCHHYQIMHIEKNSRPQPTLFIANYPHTALPNPSQFSTNYPASPAPWNFSTFPQHYDVGWCAL